MPIIIHDAMLDIPVNTCLWRYMSLSKFINLIETNSLFFCRADKFSDPHEGTIPRREFEFRQQNLQRAKESGDPERIKIEHSNEKGMQDLHQMFQMGLTVNCWHMNDSESNSMWQAYIKDNEGIVIQTTPNRIKAALKDNEIKILSTKVRYIDFENGIWRHPTEYTYKGYNLLTPIVHKRIEFKEEREYRLIREITNITNERNKTYWDNKPNTKGEHIEIDLNLLLEKVVLHPTADKGVADKVKELLTEANLNTPIEKSKMNSPRYF